MDLVFQNIFDRTVSKLHDSVNIYGEISVATIKIDLGVQWPGGPGSPEGTAPYRRTGALQEGVTKECRIESDAVVLEITSLRNGEPDVPWVLNSGAPPMKWARPYWDHAAEEIYKNAARDVGILMKR